MRTLRQQYWDYIFILNLGNCSQEPLDNLKIQKITFITENAIRQERKVSAAHFSFYRFDFGPYSKELANDVIKLERLGFIDPETRGPTKRGRYLLDFSTEFVQKSEGAQYALAALEKTCEKYKSVKSSRLVNIVYNMKIPVAGYDGKIMTVRDVPKRVHILHPGIENLADFPVFPSEALDDLRDEFAMTPEDLDPNHPDNIALTRERLDMALAH